MPRLEEVQIVNLKQKIPVVTASDENYAPYLNVMLETLIENCKEPERLLFYIIDDNLSLKSKKLLTKTTCIKEGQTITQFLTIDKSIYDDFLISDHITTTAYLRISVPEILNNDYKHQKILYVDADVLVLDDICKLYDKPLNDNTVGAVIDPGQAKKIGRLGVTSNSYYFNSGVLLIDTDRWIKKQITKKTIDFLANYNEYIVFHDQDALNAILCDDYLELHPRWNWQSSNVFNRYSAPDKKYEHWYKQGKENPAIVHFTGHDKPWNTLQRHPYQKQYLDKLLNSNFNKQGGI